MTQGSERGDCIGLAEHQWTFGIEEGQFYVHSESCGPNCPVPMYGIGDTDWLFMPPIAVKVAMATECPAYDTDDNCVPLGKPRPVGGYESGSHYIAHGTRCDCNWWPVLIPASPDISSSGGKA